MMKRKRIVERKIKECRIKTDQDIDLMEISLIYYIMKLIVLRI
jgi:hypothetical protein